MQALETHPELVRRTERLTVATLAEQLATSAPPVVLDVRTPREWQSKHIADSLNIPLNQLPGRVQEIPRQTPLVLHCQSGYRSAIAASLLERYGITTCADLVGGFAAWEARNSPWRALRPAAPERHDGPGQSRHLSRSIVL